MVRRLTRSRYSSIARLCWCDSCRCYQRPSVQFYKYFMANMTPVGRRSLIGNLRDLLFLFFFLLLLFLPPPYPSWWMRRRRKRRTRMPPNSAGLIPPQLWVFRSSVWSGMAVESHRDWYEFFFGICPGFWDHAEGEAVAKSRTNSRTEIWSLQFASSELGGFTTLKFELVERALLLASISAWRRRWNQMKSNEIERKIRETSAGHDQNVLQLDSLVMFRISS